MRLAVSAALVALAQLLAVPAALADVTPELREALDNGDIDKLLQNGDPNGRQTRSTPGQLVVMKRGSNAIHACLDANGLMVASRPETCPTNVHTLGMHDSTCHLISLRFYFDQGCLAGLCRKLLRRFYCRPHAVCFEQHL
jgi:hypothetical protein